MEYKKKLKILFIPAIYPSTNEPVKGIFIKDHAKAVSLYNEVVIIYNEGCDKKLKKLWQIISNKKENGIRTIRIKHKKSPISKTTYPIYLWSMFSAFRKLLKKGWRPDIIHAHIFSAGIPAIILGKLYNIPVVITEHWSGFPRHILGKINIIKARFVMNRAKTIISVSKDLENGIKYYKIKNNFKIIPNTINTNLFFPSFNETKICDKKKIIFVGLLTPIKGLPYLFHALNQIKKNRDDFTLDIIGDGPNRKEYELLIKKLNLKKYINFHGIKTKIEIAEFMKKCDFLVQPSLCETFGITFIEALACGKPIVGTKIPALEEKINNERGVLVPLKNTEKLAEAINYMLDHYQNYSPQKMFNYVKDNFSYNFIGKEMNNIYQKIIKKYDYKKYSVGQSKHYKIKIYNSWKVLDVGSGHNPHPRANTILDKYIKNNIERTGEKIKINYGQNFIKADACSTPFKSKAFDYIIASHIAEHIDDPSKLCEELIRIGKRGYIETPSKFCEMMLGEVFHKWYVYSKNNTLIFEKKNKSHPLGLLNKIFYAIFYANTKREGRFTLYFHNKYFRAISSRLIYYFLIKPWRIFKKITYTCFEWEDKFNYKIIDTK